MSRRTLTIELTPEIEAALDGARRAGALPSDEAAAIALILANGVSADEQERRRRILDGMRTIYPGLHGLSYGRREKEAMFEGMDA